MKNNFSVNTGMKFYIFWQKNNFLAGAPAASRQRQATSAPDWSELARLARQSARQPIYF